jgi:hypothetical protein
VGLPSRRASPSSVQPHRPRWLSAPAKMVVAQQRRQAAAGESEQTPVKIVVVYNDASTRGVAQREGLAMRARSSPYGEDRVSGLRERSE